MDLVAGPVEETGIDEDEALAGGVDAGGEVQRGAALFVHHADLNGEGRQAEGGFDPGKDLDRKCDLFGTVHFRFNNVDAAAPRVGAGLGAAQIVERDGAGEDGVEHALRDRLAGGVEHGIGKHVQADVAGEHEAATGQSEFAAAGFLPDAVGVEAAGNGAAGFFEIGGKIAAHEAEPVGVDKGLVCGVHGGDGILEVLNGR